MEWSGFQMGLREMLRGFLMDALDIVGLIWRRIIRRI